MTQDTLILELWDGRIATWTGRQKDDCLYIKVLGDRYRIWMPRGLVVSAGRAHAHAA
jgi:hypothetical protein